MFYGNKEMIVITYYNVRKQGIVVESITFVISLADLIKLSQSNIIPIRNNKHIELEMELMSEEWEMIHLSLSPS